MPAPSSRPLWGFALFAAISVVHVTALTLGAGGAAGWTKLLLMPALAIAVLAAARRPLDARLGLLLTAIALSWLGDEAGVFFSFAPELPMMLLFFGLAHLAYIVLFNRHLAVRRMPRWALVYAVWWIAMIVALLSHLGALTVAVAAYGALLGLTAASAARARPLVALGGALFLCSDSILAFRLFLPDAMPDWTSPAVMLTYCLGQGLIALGTVAVANRTRVETAR